MKKMMCFWLAENEYILMCSNTSANYKYHVHAFNILSVLTFCDVFSCRLLTGNDKISLAIWCDKHL